ncbi:MAG: hypothetical protein JWP74_1224 [Marmoricola sp.]|nr:hypothetical protein [Marmoricola sp.]
MSLKISFDLPMGSVKHWARWAGPHELVDIAAAVEDAGLDGIGMPDHPVPGSTWLSQGGHQSFDPFVALAAMAARTSRIRLHTNLAIASYRHPYLIAKAASSLDVISRGRVTLGMGAGYVAEEFAALGADFEKRGAAFDNAVRDIREVWTGEPFHARARVARGDSGTNQSLPPPVQRPGPPIWIGGNSRRARRRVAELGDGWMPFEQTADQAAITGTDVLLGADQIAEQVAEVRDQRATAGRVPGFEVCLAPKGVGAAVDLLEFIRSGGDGYEAAGVTWLTWQSSARSADQCIADIAAVGRGLSRS